MIYLLKANVCMAGFALLYFIFLRNTTFHQLNRVVLLLSIVVSLTLPLLRLESMEISLVGQMPDATKQIGEITESFAISEPIPAKYDSNVKYTWLSWIYFGYWFVVMLLLFRFIRQIISIVSLIRLSPKEYQEKYTIVKCPEVPSPFSFFRFIVFSPEKYDSTTRNYILKHESWHVAQLHTIDRLAGEVLSILFWFNPASWGLRFLIKENIEFLTDQQVMREETSPEKYQLSLLNVCITPTSLNLANGFNNSLLKNRIRMMNRKKSSWIRLFNYSYIIPFSISFIFFYNSSLAERETQKLSKKTPVPSLDNITERLISIKDTSTLEINSDLIQLKETAGMITIKGLVRDETTEEPLKKVRVQAKGMDLSTTTRENGEFVITIPKTARQLIFSAKDYLTKHLELNGQTEIVVLLRSTFSQQLKEEIILSPKGDFPKVPPISLIQRDGEKTRNENRVFILNGKKVDKSPLGNIAPEDINSIEIIRSSEALNHYQVKDENAVLILIDWNKGRK